MRVAITQGNIKRGIRGSNDKNPVSLAIADAVKKELKREVKVFVCGTDFVFVDNYLFTLEPNRPEPNPDRVVNKPGRVAQFLLDFDAGLDLQGLVFEIDKLESLPTSTRRNRGTDHP